MEAFLFNTFQLVSILLYLLLSVLMVYHRLFARWLRFSLGFFVVYLLGVYFFFGRLQLPFVAQDTANALPYFLFFFGCLACIGYCLYRRLTLWPTTGVVLCYLSLLFGVNLMLGPSLEVDVTLPQQGAIESFLGTLPRVFVYLGSPIVLGSGLYRGLSLRQMIGSYLIFCSTVLLGNVAVSSYFGRQFFLFYRLDSATTAWIEVGSVLALVLGLPATVAYCLTKSLGIKESIGRVMMFLVVIVGVLTLIQLTIGYEFLG